MRHADAGDAHHDRAPWIVAGVGGDALGMDRRRWEPAALVVAKVAHKLGGGVGLAGLDQLVGEPARRALVAERGGLEVLAQGEEELGRFLARSGVGLVRRL